MEYIAVKSFTDYVTGEHYAVGDRYPHRGFAKKDRAEELVEQLAIDHPKCVNLGFTIAFLNK